MSKKDEALKLALEAYLCREMPAGTIIGDPKWWVPKIVMAIDEALAEQHEMTNIERHERNVKKFLAEQPAQPLQEEGSAEYWASKYPVPLGYELVKKNPAQPAPMIRGDIRDGLVDDEPAQQEPMVAIRALTDQCFALIQERDELQKQVWRYEKNGVTCQTYRHKVDASCAECNVHEVYTSPPAQQNTRNATLDEIATKIAAMPFGNTAASFAVWIREQKT